MDTVLAPGARITVMTASGSLAGGIVALYKDVVLGLDHNRGRLERVGVISNLDTCLLIALVADSTGFRWALLLTEDEPSYLGWTWQVNRLKVL